MPAPGIVAGMPLLTITEIAKRLNRPAATVSYWRDKYEPWLSFVGEGPDRRYDESAVEVLGVIADAMKARISEAVLREHLSARFPVAGEQQIVTTTTPQQPVPTVADALRGIVADLLDQQRAAMLAELSLIGDQVVALRGVANQIKSALGDELRVAREQAASQGEIIGSLLERNRALAAEAEALKVRLADEIAASEAARARRWRWWPWYPR